jgi:hypothetical protein
MFQRHKYVQQLRQRSMQELRAQMEQFLNCSALQLQQLPSFHWMSVVLAESDRSVYFEDIQLIGAEGVSQDQLREQIQTLIPDFFLFIEQWTDLASRWGALDVDDQIEIKNGKTVLSFRKLI